MSVDIFSHISLGNHHLSSQFLHTFSCIFKRIYNISSSSSQYACKKTFKIAMTFLQATYNSVLTMSIRYVCVWKTALLLEERKNSRFFYDEICVYYIILYTFVTINIMPSLTNLNISRDIYTCTKSICIDIINPV